jgi:hypothetical protein
MSTSFTTRYSNLTFAQKPYWVKVAHFLASANMRQLKVIAFQVAGITNAAQARYHMWLHNYSTYWWEKGRANYSKKNTWAALLAQLLS